MSLVDEIDIASHDAYLDGVPWEQFARLRAEAPVFRHRKVEPEQPGNGFWVLTRHADVVKCNRQWEHFSSQRKGTILTEDRPDLELARMMLDLDPPEHTKYRRLLNPLFAPGVVARMEDSIRTRMRALVAELQPRRACDFVASVSVGIYRGIPVVDLDYAEDSDAETDMNVVMNEQGHFVEIQGTAEGHAFRMEELEAMLGLARSGIAALIEIQRAALSQE